VPCILSCGEGVEAILEYRPRWKAYRARLQDYSHSSQLHSDSQMLSPTIA